MISLWLQTEEDKKNLAKLASGSGGQTADEGEGLQEAGWGSGKTNIHQWMWSPWAQCCCHGLTNGITKGIIGISYVMSMWSTAEHFPQATHAISSFPCFCSMACTQRNCTAHIGVVEALTCYCNMSAERRKHAAPQCTHAADAGSVFQASW